MKVIFKLFALSSLLILSSNLLSCKEVNDDSTSIENSSNSLSSFEETKKYVIKDLEIDYLKDYNDPKHVSINSYTNFTLKVKFDEASKVRFVSFEDIDITYDTNDLEISLSASVGNQFVFLMKANTPKEIPVKFNIGNFEKTFTFSFTDSTIETSVLKVKKDFYLSEIEEDGFFLNNYADTQEFALKCKVNINDLKIDNDFFEQNSILIVTPGYSSSVEKIDYINSFIDDSKLYVNFLYKDKNNGSTLWDYYEDIYFIKVDKTYSNLTVKQLNC